MSETSGLGWNKGLTALMATAFVDMLGGAMVFPLLPLYAKTFGASPTVIGWMITSYYIAQLSMAPVWGRLSDRYGRRPMLLVGLAAECIAFVVFGLSTTVPMLFISRIVQGAGGGTTGVVQAYVGDTVEKSQRAKALGWLSAATSAGVTLGAAIGALAVQFGRAAPGFVGAALCLANIILAWWQLPESKSTQHKGAKRSIKTAIGSVIAHPFGAQQRLIWIYATGMASFQALSACVALYFAYRFGLTTRSIGWVFVYTGILQVVMRAVVLGKVVDRFGETRVMRIGALIFAGGLAMYSVPNHLWGMALVIPLVPMGQALLFPTVTALSSHRSDPAELGQMMGVQQTFGGAARILSPLWATYAFEHASPEAPFFIAAGIMGMVLLLALRVPIEPPATPAHLTSV